MVHKAIDEHLDLQAGRQTQYLRVDGGTLAYEVAGAANAVTAAKPLVVLAHGMGDDRRAYRFLLPALVGAGHRVVAVDLRGAGESSTGWASYTRTDIAGDLLAIIEHLTSSEGSAARAVLVGHSIAGGAATIAAARAPHLIAAVVELAPFTRKQTLSLADLRNAPYRRGAIYLMRTLVLGSSKAWMKYLDLAYPVSDHGTKPADWQQRSTQIATMLAEPGRMKALQAMFKSPATDAGAQLANVRQPVLVIQGSADPDWADPRAEGEAVVADLPPGLGHLEVITGSGHYPHVQHPERVLELVLTFLASTSGTAQDGARA